jgi:hypothetical protein
MRCQSLIGQKTLNTNLVFFWLKIFHHGISYFFTNRLVKNIFGQIGLIKAIKKLTIFVGNKNVLLYTFIKDGFPAGFYMLDYRTKDICDISFFGLVKEAIGMGLGKYLLKTAILTAWDSRKNKKINY